MQAADLGQTRRMINLNAFSDVGHGVLFDALLL